MSKYDMRKIPWEVHYLLKRSQKLTQVYLQIKRLHEINFLRKYAVVRNITVYIPDVRPDNFKKEVLARRSWKIIIFYIKSILMRNVSYNWTKAKFHCTVLGIMFKQ